MGLEMLSGFMGGGGGGGGGGSQGSSSTLTGGTSSSGLTLDFTSNNAFQVGGSGSSGQSASADKGTTAATKDNLPLYVGLGAALFAFILWTATHKA